MLYLENMHLFFSTPVWIQQLNNFENINDELKSYIYQARKENPDGVKKSNVNGWHSDGFDLKNQNLKNFITEISNIIGLAIKDMNWDLDAQTVRITNMWAIINKDRAFNERHHHGNSSLSAAYYVKAEKNAGDIIFFDPRQANVFHHPTAKKANNLNCQVQSITPKEGTLVLFPSYLEHKVGENQSGSERIVVSFNISLIRKQDSL